MENYSEVDIARIINDCEILILPDNSSIEEVLTNENQHLLSSFNPAGEDQFAMIPEAEETEEDFERIYQQTRANKDNSEVRRSWSSWSLLQFINFFISAADSH